MYSMYQNKQVKDYNWLEKLWIKFIFLVLFIFILGLVGVGVNLFYDLSFLLTPFLAFIIFSQAINLLFFIACSATNIKPKEKQNE